MTIWLLALSCLLGCNLDCNNGPSPGAVDTAVEVIAECLKADEGTDHHPDHVMTPQEPSAQDIVARCTRAMGGSEALENLRTLRLRETRPAGRPDIVCEIIRPNRLRKEVVGTLHVLFDGHQAWFLAYPSQTDSAYTYQHPLPESDWHHFEMDLAQYFPVFFDFGAEYTGQVQVDEAPAHVLRVELPLGGVVVYAIDAATWLPRWVEYPDWGLRLRLEDYREVGGFLFPHRFRNEQEPDHVSVLTELAVNVEFDPGAFELPPGTR